MEQRQSFQQTALKQLDIHVQKKKSLVTNLTSFTKINSKMDHKPKCEMQEL